MNCQVVGKLFDVIKEMSVSEPAEINFLKEVDNAGEIKAVDLANKMNITRSAVTQMTNKLEEKNEIERYTKPDNKKEKFIRLTETGNNILKEFETNHREANERMCEYLSSLNDDQRDTLIEFMDNLEQCMPISNFQCMGKRARAK